MCEGHHNTAHINHKRWARSRTNGPLCIYLGSHDITGCNQSQA